MVQSMKIYIGHSSNFDYREKLYRPIKRSCMTREHEIIFPHENSEDQFDSREFLENECDLMVAEVSRPSTGLGIELGWADMLNLPAILANKAGSEPSSSISSVSDNIITYESSEELVQILENKISDKEG